MLSSSRLFILFALKALILYILCLDQWGAMPLEDNLPTDNYHYQIAVYTGVRKNAGTDSRIRFILSGEDSDTGVRRMFDGKRKVCIVR